MNFSTVFDAFDSIFLNCKQTPKRKKIYCICFHIKMESQEGTQAPLVAPVAECLKIFDRQMK